MAIIFISRPGVTYYNSRLGLRLRLGLGLGLGLGSGLGFEATMAIIFISRLCDFIGSKTSCKWCSSHQDRQKYCNLFVLHCSSPGLKRSEPSNGNKTLASPSTHTFGASGRILPHEIASRNRAPERLPSCSGAVVM